MGDDADLDHDAAIDAIRGAAGVTVLSYEEAINGYLKLRGMWPPIHAAIPDGEVDADPIVIFAVAFLNGYLEDEPEEMQRHWRHVKARLTALKAELAALIHDMDRAQTTASEILAENAALKAEVAEARAKAIEDCAEAVQLTECGYAAQRFQERAIENIRSLSTSQGGQGNG